MKFELLNHAAEFTAIITEGAGSGERGYLHRAFAAEVPFAGFKRLEREAAGGAPRPGYSKELDVAPAVSADTAILQTTDRGGADRAAIWIDEIQQAVRDSPEVSRRKVPGCGNEKLGVHRLDPERTAD
jgi:hypothetical protein